MRHSRHGVAPPRSSDSSPPPLPPLDAVRTVLRRRLSTPADLDRLRVRRARLDRRRRPRVVYEAPGRNGDTVLIGARGVELRAGRDLEMRVPGSVHAPRLGLLFAPFPTDDGLPELRVAADPRAMAPIIEVALARRHERAQVRTVRVSPVRFTPGRSCLLRYDLMWDGDDPDADPRSIYGLVSTPASFERTRYTLPRLHAAARGATFAIPRPLSDVAPLALQLFSPVGGRRLSTCAGEPGFDQLCGRVGAVLHAFHTDPTPLLGAGRDQDRRVAAATFGLAALADADTARIESIARRLIERLAALPAPTRGVVHTRFQPNNVLVDGDTLALVDLQDCAIGDPAEDVGLFWSQLHWRALKQSDAGAALARDAFLAAYAERAAPRTVARLPILCAVQCFLGAYQSLRRLDDPERFDNAEILLGACEDVLEKPSPRDLFMS